MPKIAIIGDVMLDCYHQVQALREAPEGGMIHRIESTVYHPGAAANLAQCLHTLGWETHLIYPCARRHDDPSSLWIQRWCESQGIHSHEIPLAPSQTLRRNTRYLHEDKVILRADFPNPTAPDWQTLPYELLTAMDAVVLYDKGSLTSNADRMLDFCHQAHIPTYVDPCRSAANYPQAYLLKANRLEWSYLCPEDTLAHTLKQAQAWTHLVLTQDADPVLYWDEQSQAQHYPLRPCPVLDPMGAGDAFLSALITAHMEGRSLPESLPIAILAGQLTLGHRGTYAPSRRELSL